MKFRLLILYIAGIGFSNIGKWIYLVAINLKILALTDSPYALAIFYILAPIARIITNLWSGSIIDTFNKKLIMVSVDIFRFIIVFLVFLTQDIFIIYILTFLMGVIASFFGPASNVFIVNNIEQNDRKRFNAIMSTVNSGAMLTGPALAGIVISLCNIDLAILTTSTLFLVCAICISFIPNTEAKHEIDVKRESHFLIRDMQHVGHFLNANRQIFMILGLFYSTLMIGFALDSQEATYITYVLDSTSKEYGFLVAISGVGSVLGAIFSSYTSHKIGLKHYIGLGSLIGSLGYTFFYLSPNYVMAAISFFILGFFLTYANIGFTTFFQNNIPKAIMGRVGTITELFQGVLQTILTLILGYFAEAISLQLFTVLFALISVFISLGLYLYLLKLNQQEELILD
ncbi:MFS transporter [Rubeoparvulum massiliense]|uniref:MFS transporter n=1 Tax=Rubeoparvulum massiliense TaxID=1631346 RepID=UPI0009754D4A|nr:MFS transporter [Rubeoparvulum massiliense]